jgi:hypothetical protein
MLRAGSGHAITAVMSTRQTSSPEASPPTSRRTGSGGQSRGSSVPTQEHRCVREAPAAKPIALASRPPHERDARPSCLVGEQRWWWATRELTTTHAGARVSVWVTLAAPWPLPQVHGETGACGPGARAGPPLSARSAGGSPRRSAHTARPSRARGTPRSG